MLHPGEALGRPSKQAAAAVQGQRLQDCLCRSFLQKPQPPEQGRDSVSHSLPSSDSLTDCQHRTDDKAQLPESLGLKSGLKTRDFLPEG